MNFWKYTFTGKFLFYASIAWAVAAMVMLAYYITGNTRMVLIIFCTTSLLFAVGITGQLLRWIRYKKFRNSALQMWSDKSRLN